MDIAKWVFEARQHKGWTQTQLAEVMSMTKANVSGWEQERHEPSFRQMLKISAATGYPLLEGSSTSPFTAELLAAARKAPAALLRASENAARAVLDLDALPRLANEEVA